jgi:hypothetical protein
MYEHKQDYVKFALSGYQLHTVVGHCDLSQTKKAFDSHALNLMHQN